MRGRFITLEGGEGAGKTTQALELQKRLARRNIKILQTREPGGCPGGEAIRTFLQGEAARGHVFSPMAEALLMSAARAEHLDQLIRPFIEEGGWVICDRFMDSTLAYQGYARGGDKAAIKALNAQIAGDLVPDLTLFLDVSVEQSMARVDDRKTDKNPFVVYDSKEAAFHESLRCAFQEIAQDNPERVITVNGAGSPDEVAREIWSVVEVHLDPPPLPSAGTHG